MVSFQLALERLLQSFPRVAALMETAWGWPIAESIHFIGLTLLFGSIAAWDLRLLGLARNVPIAAFHRLVPYAVVGFAINASSGMFFLMTTPNQYVYNPAFHLKMFCVLLAGVNVLVFYLTIFRRLTQLAPGTRAPWFARFTGLTSLVLWMVVIVCGRMITFYRPEVCPPGEPLGFLATCIVR
jgi:hypothetical protein